jgi:apolipoprotein D and lipocalin family protein
MIRKLLPLVAAAAFAADPGPATVPALDLARYMGTWYEIAAIPSFAQKGCTDTVVHYRPAAEGGFELLNTCWKGETYKPYHGMARRTDPESPAKFYARFVLFLGSDYWVVDLDPQYRWAAVGGKSRKQLWVISREPKLDEKIYQGILARAAKQGFDVGKLARTAHTGKAAKGDPWAAP